MFAPRVAHAHCPLCTAGAGAAAIGAAWLGVSQLSIGIFIGAFALAMGLWMGRIFTRRYLPLQKPLLGLLSFTSVVLPLTAFMTDVSSVYLAWGGGYGSFFNRVVTINQFILGSVAGALIMFITPFLSRWLTRARHNKLIPFQGIILTFVLLVLGSLVIELFIL